MKRRTVQLARKNSNVFAQFDQKQITELKEAFSFIDQNGDGVIDREDLKEVWTSLGNPTYLLTVHFYLFIYIIIIIILKDLRFLIQKLTKC